MRFTVKVPRKSCGNFLTPFAHVLLSPALYSSLNIQSTILWRCAWVRIFWTLIDGLRTAISCSGRVMGAGGRPAVPLRRTRVLLVFDWKVDPGLEMKRVTWSWGTWLASVSGERGVCSVRDVLDVTLALSLWVAVNKLTITASPVIRLFRVRNVLFKTFPSHTIFFCKCGIGRGWIDVSKCIFQNVNHFFVSTTYFLLNK